MNYLFARRMHLIIGAYHTLDHSSSKCINDTIKIAAIRYFASDGITSFPSTVVTNFDLARDISTNFVADIQNLPRDCSYNLHIAVENEFGQKSLDYVCRFRVEKGSVCNISPGIIAFGNVKVGTFKDTTITICNTGDDTLKISGINASKPVFIAQPTTRILAPGASFKDTIRYTPSASGADTAYIRIISNAIYSPDSILVSGIGGSVTGVENYAQIPKELQSLSELS